VGALLAEPSRARMLMALDNGRALPASVLAMEAGVAASTASQHLARLVEGGFVEVERHGRHRYYRLSGPHVAELVEALARLAPASPVRSLREGSRAHAMRSARTCYDHLAGRLGTAIMAALIDRGVLTGGDGTFDPGHDRLSAPGRDRDYRLTDAGRTWMDDFGVKVAAESRRPLVRYCVDWSEQRHHLAGAFGAALLTRLAGIDWVRRLPTSRAVHVTLGVETP
jgi:DNA-binding transcriptional ArsR family regulator